MPRSKKLLRGHFVISRCYWFPIEKIQLVDATCFNSEPYLIYPENCVVHPFLYDA